MAGGGGGIRPLCLTGWRKELQLWNVSEILAVQRPIVQFCGGNSTDSQIFRTNGAQNGRNLRVVFIELDQDVGVAQDHDDYLGQAC